MNVFGAAKPAAAPSFSFQACAPASKTMIQRQLTPEERLQQLERLAKLTPEELREYNCRIQRLSVMG